MLSKTKLSLAVVVALAMSAPLGAAVDKPSAAAQRLGADTGAKVGMNPATGTVRFARAERGKGLARAGAQKRSDHALFFLGQHGRAFGLREPRTELRLQGERKDRLGETHVSFFQVHRNVPVFGATLKAHYDPNGNLKVVNGTLVPDLDVDVRPRKSPAEAGKLALAQIDQPGVSVRKTGLWIYRDNLANGVPGDNHLAYEVEVGNGGNIREFIYIDAHTGAKLNQITGIHDAMDRRAYNAGGAGAPGPTYPNSPYWVEGQAFPTASAEANNMLLASKETYDLFATAFGRDSFDGAGKKMDSIFNRGNACPNASWNGTFISFCPGLTTDDVTAHEWGHAYTQYTHGLIYQWQSGALNESYSDIWGETVDRLNGRQTDSETPRTAGSCSAVWGTPPVDFTVNAPTAIAGDYFAIPTNAKPALPASVTGDVALASPATACGPVTGVAGKIALVEWGNPAVSCAGSGTRANNVFNAGAIGLIFAAPTTGLLNLAGSANIISAQVSYENGVKIKQNLPANVSMTISAGTDPTVNWLVGEDVNATGLVGALRDMWNPTCFGNPGKVSDTELYVCSLAVDGGGVHINSGIPNHAFALLVDGGTYNDQTVAPIGLTKAAHLYFRASTVYQHPASNFVDHADALEQSCSDLIGAPLADLKTGAPTAAITAADCGQVATAVLAVELRMEPVQCGFEPILDPVAEPACPAGMRASSALVESFESGDSGIDRWTVARTEVVPAKFIPRDWTLVGDLPGGRPGRAFFAPNPNYACTTAVGSQAGVLHLFSPVVTVAKSGTLARMSFDHWVATEAGWDGGNLKISVNGGPYVQVNESDILFNKYNATLLPATAPNFSDNPMAGQRAWSGSDGGSNDGSWGRTLVDLTPYAAPGSKVQLRFDLGTDFCSGTFGWYVDDVNVYTCKKGK